MPFEVVTLHHRSTRTVASGWPTFTSSPTRALMIATVPAEVDTAETMVPLDSGLGFPRFSPG